MRWVKPTAILSLFLGLTLLTQIGGVVLIVAWLAVRALADRVGRTTRRLMTLSVFPSLYLVATLAIVPNVAPAFGRVPLPCAWSPGALRGASPVYCLLNRHYVVPHLHGLASDLALATRAAHPGTSTMTLDASFPFLDGMPLLPHLSHDDGRELDLAFHYGTPSKPVPPPSPIGYFGFQQPRPGDPRPCSRRARLLTLRWDLQWLQDLLPQRRFDDARNRFTLAWLADKGREYGLEKILLEPHLQARLGVDSDRVRFQGCHAARHDDHLHLQVVDLPAP